MNEDSDQWPLDLDLLGICGNDYESLGLIKDQLLEPVPSDPGILACLWDLQSRGWMMCYRYVVERVASDPGENASLDEKSRQWRQEFTPVLEFRDEEAGDLWWASTDEGIAALRASKEWRTSRGL